MNREAFQRHLIWAEGWRNKPYLCTAEKTSIGVGRNLDDRGLSDDEVMYLLTNDMTLAEKEAKTLPYYAQLDEVRQLVVCDLVFNLGLSRWLTFKRANAALEGHDYELAADEMVNSMWYTQTGRRAQRLVQAMRTGVWTW